MLLCSLGQLRLKSAKRKKTAIPEAACVRAFVPVTPQLATKCECASRFVGTSVSERVASQRKIHTPCTKRGGKKGRKASHSC